MVQSIDFILELWIPSCIVHETKCEFNWKAQKGFFYGKVLNSQISSMHYVFKMYAAQVYLYAKWLFCRWDCIFQLLRTSCIRRIIGNVHLSLTIVTESTNEFFIQTIKCAERKTICLLCTNIEWKNVLEMKMVTVKYFLAFHFMLAMWLQIIVSIKCLNLSEISMLWKLI